MSEPTLKEEVDRLFQWAIDRTANQPALENFNRLLRECHRRLHQPMRVAIVGLIKAGKSTLMNALLGEAIVATGAVEATFNVNWLRYGDRPALRVHFKDNRPPEAKSFEELAALTLRATENRAYLLTIKYIEVAYPNDILHTFNLIDTPGLNSFYREDSQNTLDFLQLHGQELSDVTRAEAANADAVLYLFSHSLGTEDKSIVEQFQGAAAGQTTPINAIGVLTKVDLCWSDPNVTDPLSTGNRIAQRLADHPQVRSLFYTIYPLCGLLALGVQTLKPEEMVTLTELAQLPAARFDSLIRNQKRFCERDYPDVSVPPVKRQQVFARLGPYGVSLACGLLRAGISGREQLREKLLENSGLNRLRELILSHFGNRALLIKLGTGLRQIDAAWFRERQRLQGEAWQIVDDIAGKFEAIKSKEHTFQELDVLRSFYEKRLNFTAEEEKQLLEVTGEFGRSCGERLGLDERATVAEMLPVAGERMQYWLQRANDPLVCDRATAAAAKVLARSYELICDRVQKARDYLYMMPISPPLPDKPQIDNQVEVVTKPPELAIEPELELSETARELIKLRDWVLLAQSGENPASPPVLEAIYQKLGQILAQEGVTVIEESGRFNYERQQVISTRPTDDPDKDDWVCDTVRPGYLFEGGLIRPQEVIVFAYENATFSPEG